MRIQRTHILILLALQAAFLSGCSIRSRVERIGGDSLIAEVDTMLTAFRAVGHTDGVIEPEFWSDTIRDLRPKEIRTYQRGVLLVSRRWERRESGVYVVCEHPQLPPSSGSGVGFTKIEDRVYWAEIKIRQLVLRSTEQPDGAVTQESAPSAAP
jgi:hypothetical protein